MTQAPVPDLERLFASAGLAPFRLLDAARPVWIFGAGRFGQDLLAVLRKAGFSVSGFIETEPKAASVLDLPVKSWTDFTAGSAPDQVAVGIFNHRTPFSELEGLARGAGFRDVSLPWDLYAQFHEALGWRYWLGLPGALTKGRRAVERAYGLLADETSRVCFRRILAFRLGMDTGFGAFTHDGSQYFNDVTLAALPDGLSYVDGGAYNGDTFLELLRHRKAASAFLFEPDPANFRGLVAAVRDLPGRPVCLPLGLMDDCRVLAFRADGLDSSALSEDGTVHVATAALDQVLPGTKVDFIKMDIEGAELPAIRGAARLIQASRPVLAISLYHRPDDLWSIPLELEPLCPDYRFSIRQHCFNSFESVVYAVPKERGGA